MKNRKFLATLLASTIVATNIYAMPATLELTDAEVATEEVHLPTILPELEDGYVEEVHLPTILPELGEEQPISNTSAFYSLTSSVKGTVKDVYGNIISGVTVQFGYGKEAETDENGYFEFDLIDNGSHYVVINAPDGRFGGSILVEGDITDLVLTVVPFSAYQTTYTREIKSYITGKGLEGATVRMKGTDLVATVDEEGKVIFNDIYTGTYTAIIEKEGYEDMEVTCEVGEFEQEVFVRADVPLIPANIKNDMLEKSIRETRLDWVNEGDITIEHLAAIETLSLLELDLTTEDYKVLEHMSNLKYLEVFNNYTGELEDLTVLSNMVNLETLLIRGQSKITDLTPLTNLKELKTLAIMNHMESTKGELANLEPLKELPHLRYLLLANNSVEDISVLSELNELVLVDLSKNHVQDIFDLTGLVANINSGNDYTYEVEIGSDIKNIEDLLNGLDYTHGNLSTVKINLSDNRISDVDTLVNLDDASKLDFSFNFIRDFKGIDSKAGYNFLNNNQKQARLKVNYINPITGEVLSEAFEEWFMPVGESVLQAVEVEGYVPVVAEKTVNFDVTKDKGMNNFVQRHIIEEEVSFEYVVEGAVIPPTPEPPTIPPVEPEPPTTPEPPVTEPEPPVIKPEKPRPTRPSFIVRPTPIEEKQEIVEEKQERIKISFILGHNKWFVNDIEQQEYIMDALPTIKNNSFYVPIRYLAYAFGVTPGEVHWMPEDGRQAFVVDKDIEIRAFEDTKLGVAYDTSFEAQAPIYMDKADRIMLPVINVLETFKDRDPSIEWHDDIKKVDIWVDYIEK